jgi:hypothetical protein
MHKHSNLSVYFASKRTVWDNKTSNFKPIVMITSNKLMEKLRIVGNALLPTQASASTFKCSNRTSIVGKSRPTLHT